MPRENAAAGSRINLSRWAIGVACCCGLLAGAGEPSIASSSTSSGSEVPAAPAPRTKDIDASIAGDPILAAALARPAPCLEKLAGIALEADAIRMARSGGDPDVALIRRRLDRLEAIRIESRNALHAGPLSCRLRARLIVAWAHERFARALEALATPSAANTNEARAAWDAQRDLTLREARLHAAAHLRSCLALADSRPHSRAATRSACERLLSSIPNADGAGNFAAGLPSEPRAIARHRSDELSVCIAQAAGRARDLMPDRIVARLDLDEAGLVQAARLEGELGSEALKACLERSLRLWAFPGLGQVTLEVPIDLRLRAD